MTPFIFADTEDNSAELLAAGKSGFDKRVTQIAAIGFDGETFYNRGNVGQFLRWCEDRPEKLIYFHNAAYDIGNLFGNQFGRHLSFRLVGSRFILARGHGLTWLDSFNIWPMALAKLGQKFGLEKLTGRRLATDKEYVFRDCEIGRAAMMFAQEFAEKYRVKKLPSTLGGFAVAVFGAMGLHNCHDGNLFARAALYGGRVELFSLGQFCDPHPRQWTDGPQWCQRGPGGAIWNCDVNSLYPSVMLNYFPREASAQSKMNGRGVCHAKVFVPESFIAPLPVRRPDGSIYFPVGTFSGVWTYAEIQAAETHGAKILKVWKCYGSAKGEDFYAPFVQRIWKERARAKSEPENLMLKLLANNLYGRLAIRGEIVGNVKGSSRLRAYQIPLPEFTNYLHAAHVTSYGRIALAEYLRRIKPENLIYCDTDSAIFYNRGQRGPFPVGGGLGEMKLVAKGRECWTFAPKMYIFDDTTKAKGVPQKFARQFIMQPEAGVTTERPYKIREVCEFIAGGGRGEKKALSVWHQVVKKRRSGYDKKVLTLGRYYPIFLGSKPRHGRANKTKHERR